MGTISDLVKKLDDFGATLDNVSKLKVPIIPDGKGMIDRQCPKKVCKSYFKIHHEDWKNIVTEEHCYCPFCKNDSPAKDYLPSGVRQALVKSLRQSLMDNWHHDTPMPWTISVPSNEEFELDIQCEKCKTRFSVIGAAYFCPACAHSSIEKTAKDAIDKLILQAKKIDLIQSALEQNLTKDEAEIYTKSIIKNALVDCIATLQVFSELKYNQASVSPAPFNAFQNVAKANKLWMALKGAGYETWLSAKENQALIIYTQRRHLLEHKGGIIDGKYLIVTGDKTYLLGEKLVVSAPDIILLGEIILKLLYHISY